MQVDVGQLCGTWFAREPGYILRAQISTYPAEVSTRLEFYLQSAISVICNNPRRQ